MIEDDARPTREQISDALDEAGWCLVLGAICAVVPTSTLAQAADVASLAVSVGDTQEHLTIDIRADGAVLRLQSAAAGAVTGRDIRLAQQISVVLRGNGFHPVPGSVQAFEIAIDALDIALVRPFWKAVTGYAGEPGSELNAALVDPAGRGPAIWFQQMDAPRPLDMYGRSKAERERHVFATGGRNLVVRGATYFSPYDSDNFAVRILNVGRVLDTRGVG